MGKFVEYSSFQELNSFVMVLPYPHNNAVRCTSYCVHLAEQKSCPFRENGRQSWDLNPSPSVLKACLATLPGSASFLGGLLEIKVSQEEWEQELPNLWE